MTEERFSLRYGYEQKPQHPIFDEAPSRLRFLIIKSLQSYFYPHNVPATVGEALCRPQLITQAIQRDNLWSVLSPYIEKASGWEIYNLIEQMYADLKRGSYHNEGQFENDVNRVFGEESIGWRLKDGKLERTLPIAAREEIDAVFKELENPRFAPAFAHIVASYKAYNARPRRDYEVCSTAFDACESVAKEVFSMPNATFGQVLIEVRSKKSFALETINVLEKLYALSNNHFRHGMTEPFALSPSEVDFVYLTCLSVILLFVRLK